MRIRRLTFGAVVLLAVLAGSVSASNHTLDDYTYVMTLGINNQSGGALANTPIAVQMQPDNLTPNFLQADAEDWRPADQAGTALNGVAQGMTSGNETWWVTIPAQGSGAVAAYDFHMGNSTATRDQSFYLDGTTDTVTATDHADLDIADDLGILVDFNLLTWPVSDTYLLRKQAAYELGVRTSGGNETIFAAVVSTVSASVTLLPNASGDFENWPAESGCASGSHWDCLQSNDGYTSRINGNDDSTLNVQDAVNVADFGPTSVTITEVDIVCDGGPSGAGTFVGVRLSGTTGTLQRADTPVDCSGVGNFARPGGGSWTPTDLDSVQLVVEVDENSDTVTEAFYYGAIVVTYDTTTTTEASTTTEQGGTLLVAGTQYRASATFDNDLGSNQLRLYVNDSDNTAEANATETDNIDTNANNVIIGTAVAGRIAEAGVANVAAEEPTGAQFVVQYEYEPDEVAETQQGDSGNSWTWLGTVEDISTGGSDHDGAYSLTRDMSNIITWTYNFRNKTTTVVVAETSPSDLLGTTAPDPAATQTGARFFGRTMLENVIEDPNFGVTALAAWFLVWAALGMGLSVVAYNATRSIFFSAIPLPLMLWLGWLLGTPIPLWVPLLFTLIVFSFAGGVGRFART